VPAAAVVAAAAEDAGAATPGPARPRARSIASQMDSTAARNATGLALNRPGGCVAGNVPSTAALTAWPFCGGCVKGSAEGGAVGSGAADEVRCAVVAGVGGAVTPCGAGHGTPGCPARSHSATSAGFSYTDAPVRVLNQYARPVERDVCTVQPPGIGWADGVDDGIAEVMMRNVAAATGAYAE